MACATSRWIAHSSLIYGGGLTMLYDRRVY